MCNNKCKLCRRLVISQAVTFAVDTLTINLPAGSYMNRQKYCIVVAQTIPAAATVAASPVVVTIGEGTETYPLLLRDGTQASARSLQTRTRYPVCVATSAAGGSFRLLTRVACAPDNTLPAIDGGATGGD